MDCVLSILNSLSCCSSSNGKIEILNKNIDSVNLKECFRLAYSPTINFYMKKLPEEDTVRYETGELSLNEALGELSAIYNREVTGSLAKKYYEDLLNKVRASDRLVLNMVVMGDLKCGVGKTIVNKIWKGLIVVPPRQGAASMNEKSLKKLNNIKNLAVELKSDGSYAASVCGSTSSLMTRNGNPLLIETLSDHLSSGAFDGFALEGELVYDLTKATREEGNGIITKIVKGTASQEEKAGAFYQVWDCIDLEYYKSKGKYSVSNKDRRVILESMVDEYNEYCVQENLVARVVLIDRFENVSVEKAMSIFEGYVLQGMEGAIAKDMDAGWADIGKPTTCIKIKRKEPADLKVVGVYEGKVGSKCEGLLGGLHCESECGTIKVNVGSGYSDEERRILLTDHPKVIECEYDSVTMDKKTKQYSLFLPIFKRTRFDKDIADNYQEILDKVRIK